MKRRRIRRYLPVSAVMLIAAYLLLLMPDRSGRGVAKQSTPTTKSAFAWNRDSYWNTIETKYQELRQSECTGADTSVQAHLEGLRRLLKVINVQKL